MIRTSTTKPRRARALVMLAALAAGTSAAAFALADEQRAVGAILDGIERDPARKAVTQDHVARAREALERATRMRTAGDETHARQADLLAREWAEAAEDLARAAAAEAKAAAARSAALDAGAQAERERALLEEGIARSGRLRAVLEQIARENARPGGGGDAPSRTSAADAGANAAAANKPRQAPAAADAGSRP